MVACSNGLTSARHDTFKKYLATEFPESFDPSIPVELVYSGGLDLVDPVEVAGHGMVPAGKLMLSPTRTYAPVIKKLFQEGLRGKIHGIVHCSGGGQTKVLHFIDGLHVVKDKMFELELSWVGSFTNGVHQKVPEDVHAEAERHAKAALEEDSDSDDEDMS